MSINLQMTSPRPGVRPSCAGRVLAALRVLVVVVLAVTLGTHGGSVSAATALKVAGPEPTTTVPYLVGLLQASAQKVLTTADLTVKVATTPVAAGDPTEGRVVSQGTPPQAEVKEKAVIEITVAVVVAPVAAPTTVPPPAPGG